MRKVTVLAVLAAVAAAGCGGGGSSASVSSYVGTWFYAAGSSLTQSCTGNPSMLLPLDGYSVTISRDPSIAGGLIHTTDFDAGCVRYLDALGSTATLASSLPCSDPHVYDSNFGEYYRLDIVPNTETLTYRGARLLTETGTTSLTYTYEDGAVLGCTSTISGASLTR